ncbi:E1 ubiquitin-activating protein aos1 [Cryomyces antarcticus]|nr:E1 ubiquitin-activating protein aos1 [Cryomyces antarcticus]
MDANGTSEALMMQNGNGFLPGVDVDILPPVNMTVQGQTQDISAGKCHILTMAFPYSLLVQMKSLSTIAKPGSGAWKRSKTNVLVVGMGALGGEIAKFMMLTGVGSLTIIDSEILREDDCMAGGFFLRLADVGKNRAQAGAPIIQDYNPRIALTVLPLDVRAQSQSFFAPFDLTFACDLDFATMSLINAKTRLVNRAFYAAGTHGLYGFAFADLINHDYILKRIVANIPTALGPESTTRAVVAATTVKESGANFELATKRELYSPLVLANSSPLPARYTTNRRLLRKVTPLLSCLRAVWDFERSLARLPSHSQADLELFTRLATEKHKELQLPMETLTAEFLRDFMQQLGAEIAPLTSLVGAKVAEDGVNVLSGKEQPLQNLALFDGDASNFPVYALHPEFEASLVVGGLAAAGVAGELPGVVVVP